MDSLRSTVAAAATFLVILPFAITVIGDSFGTVPDPAPPQTPESAPAAAAQQPTPAQEAAPAPFGVPQTSVAPAPVPAGAQIPGDG